MFFFCNSIFKSNPNDIKTICLLLFSTVSDACCRICAVHFSDTVIGHWGLAHFYQNHICRVAMTMRQVTYKEHTPFLCVSYQSFPTGIPLISRAISCVCSQSPTCSKFSRTIISDLSHSTEVLHYTDWNIDELKHKQSGEKKVVLTQTTSG